MSAGTEEVRDLIVLAADKDMSEALDSLFRARMDELGMCAVRFNILEDRPRDSGCRLHAAEHLRPFAGRYRHALVIFDYEGCGSVKARAVIQREVEQELRRNGWNDRAKAIVIKPELEAWVWSPSDAVARALGWTRFELLRRWLESQDLWPSGEPKPPDPKEAMHRVLRHRRQARSSAWFRELAKAVDFDTCRDAAFNELRTTLRRWFPLTTPPRRRRI